MSLLEVARAGHDVGVCVIPAAGDGSKRPGTGSWKDYTRRQSTLEEIDRWFGPSSRFSGLGVVCGKVSGNLEMLEFEGRAVKEGLLEQFDQAAAAAGLGDVLGRIIAGYLEHTPSGGIHLLYRCEEPVDGNLKLARRPATDDELEADPADKVKVLLETRSEAGFGIIDPSNGTTHPTGGSWVLDSGGLDQIATITAAERRAVLNLARSFDRMPHFQGGGPRPTLIKGGGGGAPTSIKATDNWEVRPGDDWAQQTSWAQILEPHGWTRLYTAADGNEAWRRPGKTTPGLSATINDNGTGCLYVFSSSTPFEPNKAYSKLTAHAALNHDGDLTATVKQLVADRYGTPAADPPGGVCMEIANPPPETDADQGRRAPPPSSTLSQGPGPASDTGLTDLFRRYTTAELLAEPDQFAWTIQGVLADPTHGQIAGEMKTLKTYLAGFIQVGLAAGVPIFDQFHVPHARPVVAYIGEGGRIPYIRRLRRIADAMGVDLAAIPLHLVFDTAPVRSAVFTESLARDLAEIKPGLVTLDPLYAYHGTETKASDLHAEGGLLNAISAPCINHDASLLVINHFNQSGTGTGLKRITMAGSGEHSDTWLLLAHRETPDVENGVFHLSLEIGSRQWGGTAWDLDLTIGRFDQDAGHHDGPITWNMRRGRTTPEDTGLDKDVKTRWAILDVLADLPWKLTKTEILDRVGGNREHRKHVFDALAGHHMIAHDRIGRIEGDALKHRPLWGIACQILDGEAYEPAPKPNPAQPDGHGSLLGDE